MDTESINLGSESRSGIDLGAESRSGIDLGAESRLGINLRARSRAGSRAATLISIKKATVYVKVAALAIE
jgi:hypothetical protein